MIMNKTVLSGRASAMPALALRPVVGSIRRAIIVRTADAAGSGPSLPGDFKLPDASKLVSQLGSKIPDVRVDISSLTKYNFFAQLVLTGVSWAVVFLATHSGLASGHNLNISTALLMVGLALSAVSAWMAFTYMKKTQTGSEPMEGFDAMDSAFEHMKINFAGVIATIFAMQSSVGTLFMTAVTDAGKNALHMAATHDYTNIAAMAQAGANIVTAHVVSLLFLALIVQRLSGQAKGLVKWGEEMRAGLSGLISSKAP